MTTRTTARAALRAGARAGYRCGECGWQTAKWVGRCGECQAWGTVEEVGAPVGQTHTGPVTSAARPIAEVDVETARARPTGLGELDRVLGGGLVPGAVVLLAGEPGVGKSTLLLDVAAQAARGGAKALYVTGEESAAQVRLRAERLQALDPELYLAAETDLGAVLGHLDAVTPSLLVIDSVQTIASAEVEGAAGGVSQVREVASTLIRAAKARGIATILVGHVTKEGSVAGPRVLEHLVDVVLAFEGERHSRLRMVRATKNRFGAADEVGCFDLGETGLTELPDPSRLFRTERTSPVAGTCVTVALEGRRPLVTEVQALVADSTQATPRRAVSGLDTSRTAMVLAVLQRRARVPLAAKEVFLATVGGVRLAEPAADLAVALAVASAYYDIPIHHHVVAVGEVGLAGEVRGVTGVRRRLAEAARLGFKVALVPPGAGPGNGPGQTGSGYGPQGLHVQEVSDVAEALALLTLPPQTGAGPGR